MKLDFDVVQLELNAIYRGQSESNDSKNALFLMSVSVFCVITIKSLLMVFHRENPLFIDVLEKYFFFFFSLLIFQTYLISQ